MTWGCQFLYYPCQFWLPYNFSSRSRPGINPLIYSKVQAKERRARGSQSLWQLLQQQPSPPLAPYSPSMFLLTAPTVTDQPPHTPHCPPSPTPHPDSPAPHTHTPLIHFMLLTYTPSTLVHRSPREIFHVGLLTPSPHFAHPHPPPHFHTQVPACLPSTLSTLCQDTLGSPPTGTLASSHCLYTLLHTNSTQKAPIYVHCHPETSPSQPFPFTVSLLSGSPRASPSGPSAYAYCPLPFCLRLTCPQSHTHTHNIKHPTS